jgi:DNA repair exonuclease SbcCD nuclease subunit
MRNHGEAAIPRSATFNPTNDVQGSLMRTFPDHPAADIVLVHSSDLHVDDDVAIGAYTGLIGLASVLATARSLSADAVLLAGDTFDNHRVSGPVLQRATDLIAAACLPVVLLPGNHDPAMADCLFRRAGIVGLPNVHALGVTDPVSILFARHGLEIYGRAHHGYADMPPFHPPRPRTTLWQIVMAHGHYVPPEERLREAHRAWKFSDEDVTATQADYVALGHWDRPVKVGDGSVPAYYSGSPDLARTVNVIRLGAAKGVTVDRVPVTWV